MVFTCTQCGVCCMQLGDYIIIERQTGPFEFECCSVASGTPFNACIDRDKETLFLERTWITEHKSACPFLRPFRDSFLCTIHETSPFQCKAYRCIILRIFSGDGKEIGRITGARVLMTVDPRLHTVWEEGERLIGWTSPDMEERIALYLHDKGYRFL